MKRSESKCALRNIVKYLDDTYPDMGTDCPFFAVAVVVFSAGALQTTSVRGYWLVDGIIVDDDRFCEETMAGEGSLWFPCAEMSKTADIYRFLGAQECVRFWKGLIGDRYLMEPSRLIM